MILNPQEEKILIAYRKATQQTKKFVRVILDLETMHDKGPEEEPAKILKFKN